MQKIKKYKMQKMPTIYKFKMKINTISSHNKVNKS